MTLLLLLVGCLFAMPITRIAIIALAGYLCCYYDYYVYWYVCCKCLMLLLLLSLLMSFVVRYWLFVIFVM